MVLVELQQSSQGWIGIFIIKADNSRSVAKDNEIPSARTQTAFTEGFKVLMWAVLHRGQKRDSLWDMASHCQNPSPNFTPTSAVVNAFPTAPAYGARFFFFFFVGDIKEYYLDFTGTREKLINANATTLQLEHRGGDSFLQKPSSPHLDFLTLRKNNTCSAPAEGWDGLVLTSPSSVTGTRSASVLSSLGLVQVRHMTYFQRSALFTPGLIVSLTSPASSSLQCYFCYSMYVMGWLKLNGVLLAQWYDQLIQSPHSTFGSLGPTFTSPSASFWQLQPIKWMFAEERPHSSRRFWEHGLVVLKMGLAGCRRAVLLVDRRRRRFPAEGVKEQVGGLVVGGNLFFQHSCLQRACLFTPWTNHSDNQQWKPGCEEIHGNFAQTFPLSCYTPQGTHMVQMHFFRCVVPFPYTVKFMHLNRFLARKQQALKHPHSASAVEEQQRCPRAHMQVRGRTHYCLGNISLPVLTFLTGDFIPVL